jgi:hypothetical protein
MYMDKSGDSAVFALTGVFDDETMAFGLINEFPEFPPDTGLAALDFE